MKSCVQIILYYYTGNFTSYHESFDFAGILYCINYHSYDKHNIDFIATTTSIEENGGSMMNTEWKGIILLSLAKF